MILDNGEFISNSSTGTKPVEYYIRVLSQDDLHKTMELQEYASAKLGNDYIPLSSNEVKTILSHDQSLGLFINDQMKGFRLVNDYIELTPGLVTALAIPPMGCESVVQLCGIYISSDMAGHRLGYRMTELPLIRLKETTRKHIFCTVALGNYPSLKNLLNLGFTIRKYVEVYGRIPRFLLHKLIQSETLPLSNHTEYIPYSDIFRERLLLQNGWAGVDIHKTNNGFDIEYRQLDAIQLLSE